ncbi:hypothetical protein Tco_0114495, partial [Tanacetum coccineum]
MILSDEDFGDRIETVSRKEITEEIIDDDKNNDNDKHDDAKIDEDKDDDDDDDDDDDHTDHALKVDKSLKEIVPKLATSTTNDLIKDNLLRLVTNVVKKEI